MEIFLKIIFFLNSLSLPLSIFIIYLISRKERSVVSISDFVRTGKDPIIFLEIVLMTGNIIQAIFSAYLFYNLNFPWVILAGTVAGILGTLVSFTRIDLHYKSHTTLTIFSLTLYSISIIASSFILVNFAMVVVGIIQAAMILIGIALGYKTKYLEVLYFALFGIWNILVITTYLK